MEENDLEEGEAYFGQRDDIDPDDLSYIDEKLQDVLGHFQKEFEGGVSAETLGAKFGGYGSFLPTYQRSSPILLPQSKSPVKLPAHNLLRSSPYNLQPDVGCQNSFVLASTSISKAHTPSAPQQVEKSCKRDAYVSTCSVEDTSHHEPFRQEKDSKDSKSLKVRIKVGPDSISTRNKPEIYSDLGLDISPSPSLEDSPGGSIELSPVSLDTFRESPSTILQVMTGFSAPGGYILSPLSSTILSLLEKEGNSITNFKGNMRQKTMAENWIASTETSYLTKDASGLTNRENKIREKSQNLVQVHGLACEDAIITPLENEVGSKALAAQKALTFSVPDKFLIYSVKEETFISKNTIKEGSKMIDDTSNNGHLIDGVHSFDFKKGSHLEISDSMGMTGAEISDRKNILSKSKAQSKTHCTELATGKNNGQFEKCQKSKSKSQKNIDEKKNISDKHRMRMDINLENEEHSKDQCAHKTCSNEKTVYKFVQAKDQIFEGEKVSNGLKINDPSFVEPNKDKESILIQLESNKVSKSSHIKAAHLDTKPKISKSQKELNKGLSAKRQSELLTNTQVQQVENGTHLGSSYKSNEKARQRQEISKPEAYCNNELFNDVPMNGDFPNDSSAPSIPALVLIEDNWVCCDVCQRWRLLPYGTNPESLPKKWHCSMQIWLPGLNKCNISQDETTKAFHELYQFPAVGSNPNFAAHVNTGASSITSAEALNPGRRLENSIHRASLSGKKKHCPMEPANMFDDSLSARVSISSKKHFTSGNKEINDGGYCKEMDPSIMPKSSLRSKSLDIAADKHISKQKEKHKTTSFYEAEGEFEKMGKHSKTLNKRGTEVDGNRASKKLRKDGSYHLLNDLHDTLGKEVSNGDVGLLAKVPRNSVQNYSEHSSKDSKFLSTTSRKLRDLVCSSNGKHKETSIASEREKTTRHNSSDKKRKLKEFRDVQTSHEISMNSEHIIGSRPVLKESMIDNGLKQKKAKLSSSEGKDFLAVAGAGYNEAKGCSTKIALSSSKKHISEVIANEQPVMDDKAVRCTNEMQRDRTHSRTVGVATSSSSKISGSQKDKTNLQEARGSPVESVSSSPMKIFNTESNSARKNSSVKRNAISTDHSGIGTPKIFSDCELDGSSDQSGTRVKEPGSKTCPKTSENYKSGEFEVPDSLKRSQIDQAAEIKSLPAVKSIDEKFLKAVKHVDVISTDCGKATALVGNGNAPQLKKYQLERSDNNHVSDEVEHCASEKNNYIQSSLHPKDKRKNLKFDSEKSKVKALGSIMEHKDILPISACNNRPTDGGNSHLISSKKDDLESHSKQHKDLDMKDAFTNVSRAKNVVPQNSQKVTSHEKQNFPDVIISEPNDRLIPNLGKGLHSSNLTKDKVEKTEKSPLQSAPEFIKGTTSEHSSVARVNNEASKSAKPPRSDEQSGTIPIPLRQCTSGAPGPSSPLKKDAHPSVNVFIKEARDLKHTANRLKSVGLEDESSGIFFESALKFLHAASLLEPSNAEGARQGDGVPSTQMMLMYYETAKFCEFCAHEFERLKEMAAASLAYKCAEVAYLKVAYYKHPSASKDRLELQVALDAPLHGESPSSSASDIDNLNNQGGLDKIASIKAVSSPQIVGIHPIAARNRPHVMRLLTYTNYLNCAFEATRKSQNAITAAGIDSGKNGIDESSARKVLDFHFHNVEGLLRLVRLSMNSIGH